MLGWKWPLCGWQTVFMLGSTFLLKALSVTAGRALHNNMLQRLLRCAKGAAPNRSHLHCCS